jgi:hypothetical protein
MSGSVEASRRHGAFDPRWRSASENGAGAVTTAPLLRAAETVKALDWKAFSNRYFPGRRRHDMEALTAYAMYTQGREWRTTLARLSVVPPERVELESEEAGTLLLAAIGTGGGNRGGTHGSREI